MQWESFWLHAPFSFGNYLEIRVAHGLTGHGLETVSSCALFNVQSDLSAGVRFEGESYADAWP